MQMILSHMILIRETKLLLLKQEVILLDEKEVSWIRV